MQYRIVELPSAAASPRNPCDGVCLGDGFLPGSLPAFRWKLAAPEVDALQDGGRGVTPKDVEFQRRQSDLAWLDETLPWVCPMEVDREISVTSGRTVSTQ